MNCVREILHQRLEKLMKGLERSLPASAAPVVLYGTNFEVDLHNHDKLQSVPGETFTFRVTDSGELKLLRRSPAQKIVS